METPLPLLVGWSSGDRSGTVVAPGGGDAWNILIFRLLVTGLVLWQAPRAGLGGNFAILLFGASYGTHWTGGAGWCGQGS